MTLNSYILNNSVYITMSLNFIKESIIILIWETKNYFKLH